MFCCSHCNFLRFFKIDNRFDVICSGSMLGIQYKKIESNSVGYKTDYQMHSLDFEEFLWACGYDHSIRTTLLNHMVTHPPFSPGILSTFFSLFMDFCILGGMPAVYGFLHPGRYASRRTGLHCKSDI